MFIRKKLNKSGSQSILLVTGERIPGKKHPVSRIIKNFGSATDPKQISSLKKEAETYKAKLEISSPKAKTLKITGETDLDSCTSYNVGFSDVYGKVFNEVFISLNLKPNLFHSLQNLAVMRIASPASKRKTVQLSPEYGIECTIDRIYKSMDQITIPLISRIKQTICQHTRQLLAEQKTYVDVLFYDLTTVYFETNSQDEMRNFGFSKDGKHQHVQIMLAVVVTKEGLPIDYEEFPGNFYEGHTLIPMLNKMKECYQIDHTVLVADAALMNKINLQELNAQNIKYMIAARLKNAKKEIKETILELSSYQSINDTINEQGILKDSIKAKVIDSGEGDFIIAYHSTERARKDRHDRDKDLEKIKQHLESTSKSKLSSRLQKSYVKVNPGCTIEIDFNKLEVESQYDGIFGLRTNIQPADPRTLLLSYRGLWQIEQTFRVVKSNLEIRPVFHYSPRRIRAHFAICYMALALLRYTEFILRNHHIHTPFDQLHLLLDKMRKVRITDSKGESFEFLEDPPLQLIPIYEALGLKWHKKI